MPDLNVPHVFTSGSKGIAADVNANFDAIETKVNTTGVHVYEAGTVRTDALANGAVTHEKMGSKTLGQQVPGGYQKITANVTPAAGATFLTINVTGDGVTPMKINIHVASVNAATDIRLFSGATQVQTFQTGTTGAAYEHVIPAFTGTVAVTVRLGASTTVVADAAKPAFVRATWAPGYST